MEDHFEHNTSHEHSKDNLRLYHKDVYMPENLMSLARRFLSNLKISEIKLTSHILNSINNNRDGISHEYTEDDIYGAILKAKRNFETVNIFELGFKEIDKSDGGKGLVLEKVCFRVSLDTDYDIAVVLAKNGLNVSVKTAWINNKNDNHTVGFNTERYYKPLGYKPKETKPNIHKKCKVIVKKRPAIHESLFNYIYTNSHIVGK